MEGRPSRRRTQEERSAATRDALLDATIECLVEYGYTRTTTLRICERAGLSRGAPQHHFATHGGLLAEAVHRLGERLTDHITAPLADMPHGPDRVARGLDILWDLYTGTLFQAVLELWVAGRTDPDLAAALGPTERELSETTAELCRTVFADLAGTPDLAATMVTVVAAVRGLAVLEVLQPSADSAAHWPAVRARLVADLTGRRHAPDGAPTTTTTT